MRYTAEVSGTYELSVTLDTVLAHDDGEALVWFALLVGRNARFLSPVYFAAAAAAVVAANLLVWTAQQDGPLRDALDYVIL